MDNGFVILAQNTQTIDYVVCAENLANSIKRVMPDANITLISNNDSTCPAFTDTVRLPYGDLAPDSNWKLINDWQVYDATPYEYTIKLEADMYVPSSIEYYWDVLKSRDLVISTSIRDYKGNLSDVRAYRRFVDINKLPDCYNAMTYFRKSAIADRFFKIVREIFEHWEQYRSILQCNVDEPVTTDWAYSIASHIVGVENSTLPGFDSFSMIHMKPFINDLLQNDWTKELVYEFTDNGLRINTYPQLYPFHYHIKTFAAEIRKHYG